MYYINKNVNVQKIETNETEENAKYIIHDNKLSSKIFGQYIVNEHLNITFMYKVSIYFSSASNICQHLAIFL